MYEKILVKRTCWLLGVFLISWTPFYLLKVIISYDECKLVENAYVHSLQKYFTKLGYIGSCINPFLYAMLTDDFRKDVVKFIGGIAGIDKIACCLELCFHIEYEDETDVPESTENSTKLHF